MQFKHPELLYALFLLLIPIIVHLFQLRRFEKIDFTNVAFLKEATMQTRKSSQIKKWLILFTRLLLLAALVFAFAQPFTSNIEVFNKEKETIIYLDNSFSMQAKGNKGELMKRAIQDLINNVPEEEEITLFTNDKVFKNTTIKTIKNDLLQLDYASNTTSLQAALLKSQTFTKKTTNSLNNIILISDFQSNKNKEELNLDSINNFHFVKLEPVNNNNIAIDSAFISETTASSTTLKVLFKNSGNSVKNLPVSLFNKDKLIAKTSLELEAFGNNETTFSLPANQNIDGKITIDDAHLQFDNTFYFNINNDTKINVLAVSAGSDSFLKRIYPSNEFNYQSSPENQLNYNIIDKQNLIILNELEVISGALSSALKQFSKQGGTVLIIPSETSNLDSYNQLLTDYKASFSKQIKSDKRITTINYSHPIYNRGVFEKQVKNFQFPKVNSFYGLNGGSLSEVLQFEDGKPFLAQAKQTYFFTAALNKENSNFKNSPLIVPTLYNIAKASFKTPELFYTVGKENTFDVDIQMQSDHVLSLVSGDVNLIPRQQYFNNKVVISTSETPTKAGIYEIKDKSETLKKVSFNYSRAESNLNYNDLSSQENITVSNSITTVFDSLKSDSKINALWKWFVIFALALLIIEMLILKFFK